MTRFEQWWVEEGSQAPYTHHDSEEHTKRMCEIAWANGAYVEREECAKLCDYVYNNIVTDEHIKNMAFKIRARGQE